MKECEYRLIPKFGPYIVCRRVNRHLSKTESKICLNTEKCPLEDFFKEQEKKFKNRP